MIGMRDAARRRGCRVLALLLCLMVLGWAPVRSSAATEQTERQVVRVGFFAYEGYHMVDTDGNRSGYGYEFLRLASRYMNVDFEYVGYEKSWEEMQQMLADGEIDLLTFAQKTEARNDQYEFSKPIGTSSGLLTVKSDNNTIVSQVYSTYDGMRVGMLRNFSRNSGFEELAKEKGFTYEPVYFNSASEMTNALQLGRVDAIVSNSLRLRKNERVLDEFAAGNFYALVKKGNTQLLAQLNYAIDQLNATEGDWKNRLYYECYGAENDKDYSFTEREQELIRQYSEGGKKLVASCSIDRAPYSYVEDGELKGIIPDLFASIMQRAGLNYELIAPESREQYVAWQEDGPVDLFLDARIVSESKVEEMGYASTAPYLDMKLALVTRKDFDGEISTLGVADAQGIAGIEDQLVPEAERVLYETREQALEAVVKGKVDAAFAYVYTAQQFVNNDERGILTYTVMEEPSYDYCIVINGRIDRELSGILTKCIYQLPEGEKEQIISGYTSYKAANVNLYTFLRLHPAVSAAALAAAVVILMIVVTLGMGLHSRQKLLAFERQKADEMALLAKQAQAASESKSRFLFNMSHDIRTPMNAVIGFANLALATEDPAKTRDYLNKIRLSGDHLLGIINEVLEMSRIENGRITLEETENDLPALVDEVADMIQCRAQEKNQSFTIDLSGVRQNAVLCDRLRLKEILVNLLSNAVKYTGTGGRIALRIRQLPETEPGFGRYEMQIRDNGIGMQPAFLEKVFDPFEREQTATVSGIEGTGLGLSITKRLVDLMGGQIEITSEEGHGTQVNVRLRLKLAEPAAPAEPEPQALPGGSFAGRRLLLAEDNALNREIAAAILTEAGFAVDSVEDGAQALEKLCAGGPGRYDVVLMDIQMPVLDGYAATRQIRCLKDPALAATPVVAISANAFEEDRQKAKEAGMNGFVPKPIRVDQLNAVLKTVLPPKPQP